MIQWASSYMTYQRSVRLITGGRGIAVEDTSQSDHSRVDRVRRCRHRAFRRADPAVGRRRVLLAGSVSLAAACRHRGEQPRARRGDGSVAWRRPPCSCSTAWRGSPSRCGAAASVDVFLEGIRRLIRAGAASSSAFMLLWGFNYRRLPLETTLEGGTAARPYRSDAASRPSARPWSLSVRLRPRRR